MTQVDIRALAQLARLEVSDEELARLEKEIPDIIGFVETIQKATVALGETAPTLRNVMRADEDAHESGEYTERLLKGAPVVEKDRIVVKQVVSRNTRK